jgi:hypothetical protein
MDRYTADDMYRTGEQTQTSHYSTYQDTGMAQKLCKSNDNTYT